jgi:hypothetical protein
MMIYRLSASRPLRQRRRQRKEAEGSLGRMRKKTAYSHAFFVSMERLASSACWSSGSNRSCRHAQVHAGGGDSNSNNLQQEVRDAKISLLFSPCPVFDIGCTIE